MLIVFAGITLAHPSDYPPSGLVVNGESVYEPVQILRAARQTILPRGNELVTLQFAVSRELPSLREAQRWVLGLYSSLPKYGDCAITLGEGEDTETISMPGAILTLQAQHLGVRVQLTYTLTGGGIDLAEPIATLPDPTQMIQSASQSIATSATSVSVVFPQAFGSSPAVTATIQKPTDGDNLWATIIAGTVSTTGFSAALSGPVPADGYKLNWTAVG